MITRAQITKLASADGVDAKTVERDYVLTHLVALVARHDAAGFLAFKGGTALRILYFDNYRYSADLDYSILRGTYENALDLLREALANTTLESITKLRLANEASGCWIYYEGPLRSERSIKIDLSDDELVVNTEPARLIARWPDVPAIPILAYTRLEVTAEKLRCVVQRFQCRDLLDLDLLFEDGIDPSDAAALFVRKAAHKSIDPLIFRDAFEGKIVRYKKAWQTELAPYLSDAPHFDEVERRVRRALRRAKLLS